MKILFLMFLQVVNCLTISENSEKEIMENYPNILSECPETALRIPSFFPIYDFQNAKITSEFGIRLHPVSNVKKHHNGIDIATPKISVIATASGIVNFVGVSKTLGNFIIIDHLNGYKTIYGHLDKIFVRKNEYVSFFQILGVVGSTGLSTGNHIHYEVKRNNINVDPINYLLLLYDALKNNVFFN